jgi:hypothetical protein
MVRSPGVLVAQIMPVPDGRSVALMISLLALSLIVLAAGAFLVFRGLRGPRSRKAWLLGSSGLILCASALLLWAWLGVLGQRARRALEWPTRRAWDLSSGNEVARLGEENVPGLRAWGGTLDFRIALPAERKLSGRARFVSVDNRDGRIQRLRWRSATSTEPCSLLQETSTSLRLRVDRSPAACRSAVAARNPRDPGSPSWTVCTAETEVPRVTAQILGSYDPGQPDLSVVEVTVVWDRRLRDPLVDLPACPCDQGGGPSCSVADLRR